MKKLFPHKPVVRIILVGFILGFILMQCKPAWADPAKWAEPVPAGNEVRVAPGYRVIRSETPVLRLELAFADQFTPYTRIVAGIGLFGSADTPYGPARQNGFFYAGLEAQRGPVSLMLGPAKLFNAAPDSGTLNQFALGIRYRYWSKGKGHCALSWFHMSNSGINPPNPGFDFVSPIDCTLRW